MAEQFYSIFVLLYITFTPLGGPMKETVAIHGIYKSGQECVDRMEHFSKLDRGRLTKYGCVQVVHPTDDQRMQEEHERKHREEGSHSDSH